MEFLGENIDLTERIKRFKTKFLKFESLLLRHKKSLEM